ncbi:MAG: hypothetical protein QF464_24495, partial [Myxococcota bacterium]|nr:hypothetical protein [Myxococcota bacterium]
PLSLDREPQKGRIDGLAARNDRVHVLALHGEVQQGHSQCADLAFREVSQRRDSLWTRLRIRWPGRAAPEARLGELVQRLGRQLGLSDPAPTAPLQTQIEALRERIRTRLDRGPLFVQHTIGKVRGEDDQLLEDYLNQLWRTDTALAWPCILTIEMTHMEPGFLMTDSWRAARRGRRHTAAVCARLSDMRSPYLRGRNIPELTSVTRDQLRDWVEEHLEVEDPEEV